MARLDLRDSPAAFQALNEGLEREQYVLRVPTAGWVLSGGALASVTANSCFITLVDVATPQVNFSVERPEAWLNGEMFYRFTYTGTLSSTNQIDLVVKLWELAAGETIGAATTLTDSIGIAGPSAANVVIDNGLSASSLAVAADAVQVGVSISRATTDAYTGSFRLTSFALVFYPNPR